MIIVYLVAALLCIESNAAYDPQAYRSLLMQTQTSLQERADTLTKKIIATQNQLTEAGSKKLQPRFLRKKEQIDFVVDANRQMLHNLEGSRRILNEQLSQIQSTQDRLKNMGITDKKHEARLIQELRNKLNVADLNQQIMQTQQSEDFLLKRQRVVRTGSERNNISQILGNLRKKRVSLQNKIRNLVR